MRKISATNIKMKSSQLKKKLYSLFQLTEIIPYDYEVIIDGLRLNFTDIEESFQFISALKCKADFLITEDKRFLQEDIIINDKVHIISTSGFLINR